jgi:hypothetical protein
VQIIDVAPKKSQAHDFSNLFGFSDSSSSRPSQQAQSAPIPQYMSINLQPPQQPPIAKCSNQVDFANFFGSSPLKMASNPQPTRPAPIPQDGSLYSKPSEEKKKTFNKLFGLDGGGGGSPFI